MNEGLVDTNVFLHAITRDKHARECQAFLILVEEGRLQVRIDPLVIHELTYVLPRLGQHRTRAEIATFLLAILAWPGIVGEKGLLVDAIQRWRASTEIGFVDAFLTARGRRDGCPIYTKNVGDFLDHGVEIPDPLPSGATSDSKS